MTTQNKASSHCNFGLQTCWLAQTFNFHWETIQLVTKQHNSVDLDVSLECEAVVLEKISAAPSIQLSLSVTSHI